MYCLFIVVHLIKRLGWLKHAVCSIPNQKEQFHLYFMLPLLHFIVFHCYSVIYNTLFLSGPPLNAYSYYLNGNGVKYQNITEPCLKFLLTIKYQHLEKIILFVYSLWCERYTL